jgi:hypothetical protein
MKATCTVYPRTLKRTSGSFVDTCASSTPSAKPSTQLAYSLPIAIYTRVVVVSPEFTGKTLIQQHRLVNTALQDELASGVHALALQTKTPEQWERLQHKPITAEASPTCLGGKKREQQQQQ